MVLSIFSSLFFRHYCTFVHTHCCVCVIIQINKRWWVKERERKYSHINFSLLHFHFSHTLLKRHSNFARAVAAVVAAVSYHHQQTTHKKAVQINLIDVMIKITSICCCCCCCWCHFFFFSRHFLWKNCFTTSVCVRVLYSRTCDYRPVFWILFTLPYDEMSNVASFLHCLPYNFIVWWWYVNVHIKHS